MIKLLKIFLPVSLMLQLFSCATGYISKNGTSLQKYLEPKVLREITVKPDPDIWIIDARPKSFYKSGHIPTARSYSIGEISDRLNEIPRDKSLIVYCVFSPGAQSVIRKLEEAGYSKLMNWGAYSRWPYEEEKSEQ